MKKFITAVLAASMFMLTACNAGSKPAASSTGATEMTTETTTAATETTTETTTEPTSKDLKMTIDEVAKALIDKTNCGFAVDPLTDPSSSEFFEKPMLEKQKTVGIQNHRTVSFFYEDPKNDDNSITVIVDIYEYDMESKEYKALSENKEFKAFRVSGYADKYDAYDIECTASAINKQYVIEIYAFTGSVKDEEETAPFKIEQAQKIYDAFKNLK